MTYEDLLITSGKTQNKKLVPALTNASSPFPFPSITWPATLSVLQPFIIKLNWLGRRKIETYTFHRLKLVDHISIKGAPKRGSSEIKQFHKSRVIFSNNAHQFTCNNHSTISPFAWYRQSTYSYVRIVDSHVPKSKVNPELTFDTSRKDSTLTLSKIISIPWIGEPFGKSTRSTPVARCRGLLRIFRKASRGSSSPAHLKIPTVLAFRTISCISDLFNTYSQREAEQFYHLELKSVLVEHTQIVADRYMKIFAVLNSL